MANEYFSKPTDLAPYTRARAEDMNDRFTGVASGFDKLPLPHLTERGFREAVHVGDATARTHSPSASQIIRGALTSVVDTGVANAYVATLPVAPVALVAGMQVSFRAANTNSGASTLNLNNLGAKNIVRQTGNSLSSGDIVAGQVVTVTYDGTRWVATSYLPGQAATIATQVTAASNSATAAAAARDAAQLAQAGAETARTGAETARIGAETARTGAETAQTAAQAANTTAQAAKTGAETARDLAVSARTGAETARDQAVTARTGAETARTGAEAAQTGAQAANTAAQSAKTGAETARDQAVIAKTGAETARTGAETAQVGAETARTAAEAAAAEAENTTAGIVAAGDAQVARVLAEGNTQDTRLETEGDTQIARVVTEGNTQESRLETEGDTQVARVVAEGNTQDLRVEGEGNTQVARVIAEGNTQELRVESEGDTQVARVTAEGTVQVGLAAAQVTLATAQAGRAEDEADRAEGYANDTGNISQVNKFLAVTCTGLSTLSLDCATYDTFYLTNFTVDIALTLANADIGRTVTIFTSNGAAVTISFTNTIRWPGGAAPEFTAQIDALVLTKISSTVFVGGYSLELI